ncbi:Hypothetical proteinypothetical proteinP domain [Nesidiocoris tenuis]|uniref:Protein kinase C-binding protein 1 n=1 Tax=Nesidiocoris tenuis TaxID=355587 RepID=A0ABN7AYY1_9HEMI|nr:Hypothetical proteinypothetical proteinP domain [Nesidiocoris tenuis]
MSVSSSSDKVIDRSSQPRKSLADKNEKKATKLTGNKDVFCWTCHRSNNLATCSHCVRGFHLKCSNLEKFPEKAGKWICPECDNILRANKGPLGARTPKQVEKLAKLLNLVIDRLAAVDKDNYFAVPVDVKKWHDYLDFVIKPMDLLTLRKNVERKLYRSTEQFLADFRWLVHNSYIFNSVHSDYTKMAKSLLNVARHECEEVKSCQDCYEHSHTHDPQVSFLLPCSVPHVIVWAQLSGFPYWPAKVIKRLGGDVVDVRFFGDHSRANVLMSSCFLYSRHMPANIPKKSSKNAKIARGIEEAEEHIKQLKLKYGSFHFAKYRVPYVAKDEEILRKLQLPGYSEPGETAEFCKIVEELRPLQMINDKDFRSEVRDMKKKMSLSSIKRKSSEFSPSPGFRSPKEFVFLTTPTGNQCAVVNWSGSESDSSPDKKSECFTSPRLETRPSPPLNRPKMLLDVPPSTASVSLKSKRSSLPKPTALPLSPADNTRDSNSSPPKVVKLSSPKPTRQASSKRHQPQADCPASRRRAPSTRSKLTCLLEKIEMSDKAPVPALPEASHPVPPGIADSATEDVAPKAPEKSFQKVTKEVCQKLPEEKLLDVAGNIPKVVPEEVPEVVPQKLPVDTPQVGTEDGLQEVPEEKPPKATEHVPEKVTENIPQKDVKAVPQKVIGKASQNLSEDFVPKESQVQKAEDAPKEAAEFLPQIARLPVTENLAEKIPGDILQKTDLSNGLADNNVDASPIERNLDSAVDVGPSSDNVESGSKNQNEKPPCDFINLNGDISHYLLSVESSCYDIDSADEMEREENAYCKMNYKVESSSKEADVEVSGIADEEPQTATVLSTSPADLQSVKKLDDDVGNLESEQISANCLQPEVVNQQLHKTDPAEPTHKMDCDISLTSAVTMKEMTDQSMDIPGNPVDSSPSQSASASQNLSQSPSESEKAEDSVEDPPDPGNQAMANGVCGSEILDRELTCVTPLDAKVQSVEVGNNGQPSNLTSRSPMNDHKMECCPDAADFAAQKDDTTVETSASADARQLSTSFETITSPDGKAPFPEEPVTSEGDSEGDGAGTGETLADSSAGTKIGEDLSESNGLPNGKSVEDNESLSSQLKESEHVPASQASIEDNGENQPTEEQKLDSQASISVAPLSKIETPTLKRKSPPVTRGPGASEPKKSKSGDLDVHPQSDIIIASSMSLINGSSHVEIGQSSDPIVNRKRTRQSSREIEQKKAKDLPKDVAMPIPLIEIKTEPLDYDEVTEDSPPLAKKSSSAEAVRRNSVSAGTRMRLKVKPISSLIEKSVAPPRGPIAAPPALVPLGTRNPPRPTTPKHNMIPPFAPRTTLQDVRDLIQSKAKFINRGLKDDLIAKLTDVEQEYESHLDFVTSFAEKNLKEVELTLESNKAKMYEEMKNKIKEDMGSLLVEARRKQWCVKCGSEANFHCCWSYSYCSDRCQKGDWPSHVQVCTQYQMDVKDPRVRPSPHYQSVIEFISRQLPGTKMTFQSLTELAQRLPSPPPPPKRGRNSKAKAPSAATGQKINPSAISIPNLALAEPLGFRHSEGLDQFRLSNCKTYPVKLVSQSSTSSSLSSPSSSGGKYFVLQHPISKNVRVTCPTTSNGLGRPISSPSVSAKSLPNFGKSVTKPANSLRIAPNVYARNAANPKGTLRIMNEGELASILKRNNLKL